MKTKVGRPSKLTPELQEKFIGLLADHQFIKTACHACGITQQVYYHWREQGRGKKDENGNWVIYPKAKYRKFIERCEQAMANSEENLVKMIVNEGGWKGALAILQRRHKKNWGKEVKTTITGVNDGPIVTASTVEEVRPSITINIEGGKQLTAQTESPESQWGNVLKAGGVTPAADA